MQGTKIKVKVIHNKWNFFCLPHCMFAVRLVKHGSICSRDIVPTRLINKSTDFKVNISFIKYTPFFCFNSCSLRSWWKYVNFSRVIAWTILNIQRSSFKVKAKFKVIHIKLVWDQWICRNLVKHYCTDKTHSAHSNQGTDIKVKVKDKDIHNE